MSCSGCGATSAYPSRFTPLFIKSPTNIFARALHSSIAFIYTNSSKKSLNIIHQTSICCNANVVVQDEEEFGEDEEEVDDDNDEDTVADGDDNGMAVDEDHDAEFTDVEMVPQVQGVVHDQHFDFSSQLSQPYQDYRLDPQAGQWSGVPLLERE